MTDLGSVLVIDDDAAFRFALKKALRRMGFDVSEAESGEAALPMLSSETPPHVALLDLRMRGMSGIDVLKRRAKRDTRVIVLTGHGTVSAAVTAMHLGAYSFLEKPVDAEELEPLLRQAISESRAAKAAQASTNIPPLIGNGEAMGEVRSFIETVGPTDETVMVYGETGTGKEVVAQHVHAASMRSAKQFVAMNAACVPRELFESELFGHVKGAFTGASANRDGLFREASGGTLFIDELAEMPLDCQAKILRALETRHIRPVGDSKEVPVDVRIVAATNGDLWSEVQAGRFREDLFFRLQVFPVVVPPLRDRVEDLPELTEHLLLRLGGHCPGVSKEGMKALQQHHWPGNVRELLNVLRRASLFAKGREVSVDLIRKMVAASVFSSEATSLPRTDAMSPVSGNKDLATVERDHIEGVLRECRGNVTKAAIALGIDRRTLQRKIKSWDS